MTSAIYDVRTRFIRGRLGDARGPWGETPTAVDAQGLCPQAILPPAERPYNQANRNSQLGSVNQRGDSRERPAPLSHRIDRLIPALTMAVIGLALVLLGYAVALPAVPTVIVTIDGR